MTYLLSRPSAAPTAVSANLHYTFSSDDDGDELYESFEVRDHCNSLILLQDCVVNPEHAAVVHMHGHMHGLLDSPKEVVFLNDSCVRVLAYHLNSSKIQDLGYVYREDKVHHLGNEEPCVEMSFPYTPCWMGDFPQND
ncbi:hypothetical protein BAE44_0025896 [Dichanthelium oligosanthes]|uniref:Uncharacterized protein n=1 Tax=Dichanthelium oligosanthes TaxID=888268 RepID=A0A1E5UJM4_9POAL|nr:hypothetical protein BAE44_0025896 [Dichanthelium oligosanthes]